MDGPLFKYNSVTEDDSLSGAGYVTVRKEIGAG